MLCHKKGQYEKTRKLQVAGQRWNGAFLGSMMHAARRQWWNDGFSGELWRDAINQEALRAPDEIRINLAAEAATLFEAYRDHWVNAPRPEVLALEYPIPPGGRRPIGAVLDAVIRVNGALYVDEMKNENRWIPEMYRYWSKDWQIMVEQWCWGKEETERFGGPLCGTALDLVSTRKTTKRVGDFDREIVPLVQPAWLHEAVWTAYQRMQATGPLTIVPRNPAACNQGRYQCNYMDLCFTGPSAAGGFVNASGQIPTPEECE